MKDNRGLFYYPNPLNKKFRMYIREVDGDICFRMWNADDPALWTQHDWIPYGAIKKATEMYDGKTIDPGQAYDIEIAQALLKEDRRS